MGTSATQEQTEMQRSGMQGRANSELVDVATLNAMQRSEMECRGTAYTIKKTSILVPYSRFHPLEYSYSKFCFNQLEQDLKLSKQSFSTIKPGTILMPLSKSSGCPFKLTKTTFISLACKDLIASSIA